MRAIPASETSAAPRSAIGADSGIGDGPAATAATAGSGKLAKKPSVPMSIQVWNCADAATGSAVMNVHQ